MRQRRDGRNGVLAARRRPDAGAAINSSARSIAAPRASQGFAAEAACGPRLAKRRRRQQRRGDAEQHLVARMRQRQIDERRDQQRPAIIGSRTLPCQHKA